MLSNWFSPGSPGSEAKKVKHQGPYEGPDYFDFVVGKMGDPNVSGFISSITKETREVATAGLPHGDQEEVNRTIDAAVNRAIQACNNDPKILACFIMGMLGASLDEREDAAMQAKMKMVSGTLPEILEKIQKMIENGEE